MEASSTRVFRAFVGVMLAIVLLMVSACSNAGDDEPSPSHAGKEQTPTATPGEGSDPPDPLGRYDDTVVMTIGKGVIPDDNSLPEGDTVDNNQFTRFIEERLNVKFEAIWVAAGTEAYKQKMKLAIASNDLPDAMVVGETDLRMMVKSGQVADLTEVYETYASEQLKGMYEGTEGRAFEGATFDGKLMALPNVNVKNDSVQLLWIRQDWLDELGLEPPKTMDEIAAVARAFQAADMGGDETYGLVGSNFYALFKAYGSYPRLWMKNEEGKAVYGSVAPETKTALAALNKLYEEGILDPEYAIRKNMNELVVSGKAGMLLSPWWAPFFPLNDAVKLNPSADWRAYLAPLDANGEFNGRMNPASSHYFVVRKGYSNPEALVKYLNLYSSVETDESMLAQLDKSVNANYWPLRAVMVHPNVLALRYEGLKKALDDELKPEDLTVDQRDIYNSVKKDEENPFEDMGAWALGNAYLRGASVLQADMNEVYSVNNTPTKTMELKGPALSKLEEEVFNKIIMGTAPIEAFDQFVKDWEKQGGLEIASEVEAAIQK